MFRIVPVRPTALLVVSLACPALASEVRVSTLAQPAGIDDEAMVFTYPSLVNRYSLAIAEFGTAANQEAYAAAMTQTAAGSFGAAFSRDQSAFSYVNTATNATNDPDFVARHFQRYSFARKYAAGFAATPKRPVDLFYGRPIGVDRGFGVRVTLAGETDETDTGGAAGAKVKKDASQADFGVGFHTPVATGRLDLGLGLGLVGKLENSTAPATGAKTAKAYDRGVSGRFSARWVDISAAPVKPYLKASLEFMQPKVKVEAGGTSTTKKAKDLGFDLQAGAIAAPTESVRLNAGAGGFHLQSEGPFTLGAPQGTPIESALRSGTETVTENVTGPRATRRAYGLALNAGAEVGLTESLGVMAGVNYMLWGRIVTRNKAAAGEPRYTTNLAETSDADLFSLGLYYRREALRIDAATAIKRFVHNGPHFLTGNSTPTVVAQFAATYGF